MFTVSTLSLKATGSVNSLVLNYLEKDKKLESYYSFYPNLEGFSDFLKTNPYSNFNRPLLSDILLQQHKTVSNTSEKSIENVLRLKEKNVFTITTGHQLCLFTGPLYFIYKIFSAINLSESLNKEFPNSYFVPVYWMAAEDHDFEEVNHVHLFGKKLAWHSEQRGAVGDFKTKELNSLLNELKEILGQSENANDLISLFERSYLKHETLSEATRFLINELFGEYGLLTVDGNDKKFKEQFSAYFKDDIFNQSNFQAVTESIAELNTLDFEAQVKPRSINAFFMEPGLRSRIESEGENFKIVGTNVSLTKQELERVVVENSEKISPNVVLRPVYQQYILPNLAYVGGPGELAYWLEFKKMFDLQKVEFPILVPRSFVSIIEKNVRNKISKLNFSESDFFKMEEELIKQMQVNSGSVFEVVKEKESVTKIYELLSEKISHIDKTIGGSVSAELQKSLAGLENVSSKANRALKQKMENEISQIRTIRQKLFPDGVPQERHENFSSFYLKFGKEFFKCLKESINPLLIRHNLILED